MTERRGAGGWRGSRAGLSVWLLRVLMVVGLVSVVARVAQLQVAPEGALAAHLGGQWSERTLSPTRGALLDRRGRVLATSHTGYRVFVDPARLAEPPDEAIVSIAEATGTPADEVGARVYDALARRDARIAAIEAWEASGSDPEGDPGPRIRFWPVTGLVHVDRVDAVRAVCAAFAGVHLEARSVRSMTAGSEAAFLVGKVGQPEVGKPARGLVGAEATLDGSLAGEAGSARFVRDHRGRPLWIGSDAWSSAEDGAALRLSIDLEIQRIATEELWRGMEESDAAGGRMVVVDPLTGDVLAMVDLLRPIEGLMEYPWAPIDASKVEPSALADAEARRARASEGGVRFRALMDDPWRDREPALARNRCVEDVYEPGSTLKPLVWAALTDAGVVSVGEVIDTEGGRWRTSYGRRVEDVTKRDRMTWGEVLLHSSNIGMAKGAERVSFGALREMVTRFGFGRRVGLALPGEAPGLVTSARDWGKYTQTSVAFGYEIAVTPVQMARAFSALARGGEDAGTAPALSLVARRDRGGVVERLVSEETARVAREVLGGVAGRVEAKMARRGERGLGVGAGASSGVEGSGWAYSWFGKSGTAEIPLPTPPKGWRRPKGAKGYFDRQYCVSFVAAGPVEGARVVVVVVIDDPGPETIRANRYYGSDVAGPVARRTIERVLGYMGISPDRIPEQDSILLGSSGGFGAPGSQ